MGNVEYEDGTIMQPRTAHEETRRALVLSMPIALSMPSIVLTDTNTEVIEFFDYNCGFCRRAYNFFKEYGDQFENVFFKRHNYPILGDDSMYAARVSVAMGSFNLFEDFYHALMDTKYRHNRQSVNDTARDFGVSERDLNELVHSTSVADSLAQSRELGRSLGARGTPYFVVDGQVVKGFDRSALERLLL